ncbi:SGNH/GDSL hydrolase family protein [Sphingomonas faeni]|uniref:SGNH/GDSL hydrolase family protein n=1 Tax=Sphingomonas faeni TaxID=185950 RepID=UPI00335BF672
MAEIPTFLIDGQDVPMPALRLYLTRLSTTASAALLSSIDGAAPYETLALAQAAPASDAGNQARVYADPDTAKNGVYVNRTGAVGGYVVDTGFYSQLAAVVQPVVDKARDWAEGTGSPGGDGTRSAKSWASEASAAIMQNVRWGPTDLTPSDIAGALGATTYVNTVPLPRGPLPRLSLDYYRVGGAGAKLAIVTLKPDLSIDTIVSTYNRAFANGVSVVTDWNYTVAADNLYLAIRTNDAPVLDLPAYHPKVGAKTLTGVQGAALASGQQLAYTPLDYELLINAEVAALGQLTTTAEMLEASQSLNDRGVSPVATPAGNSAAIRDGLLAFPMPRLPAGDYQADTVSPGRVWGNGRLFDRGGRVFLPAAPRDLDFRRHFRTILERVCVAGGTVTALGDSLLEGFGLPDILTNQWWTRFAQACIGDLDTTSVIGMTNFVVGGYGMTYSGGSQGGSGPAGTARVLAAGDSMSFTGTFSGVAYTYDRSPGAGTLTLTRAGSGSALDAQSTAGTAANDVSRTPIATGTTASDTYTLTASGGSVTVTSLFRIGIRAANVRVPNFHRICRANWRMAQFATDAPLASIIAQASRGVTGTAVPGLLIIAAGTNDANPDAGAGGSTPVASYQANLEKVFAEALDAGLYVVKLGIPPSNNNVHSGTVYVDYVAAEVAACERYSVPYIPLYAIDFFGRGLTIDGLHWNAAGNEAVLRSACDAFASPVISMLTYQARMRGRVDVTGAGAPALTALGGSTYRRTDGGAGSTFYVKEGPAYDAAGWAAK